MSNLFSLNCHFRRLPPMVGLCVVWIAVHWGRWALAPDGCPD